MEEELMMSQLSETGTFNVFNFLLLKHLTEILKRNDLSKQAKLLAINRYLESDSLEKNKDGQDSEAYTNLVSYTTFFSDKH